MPEPSKEARIPAVVASFSVTEARAHEFEEISRLVNKAYRGDGGWTNEAGLVEGPRTTPADLERELADPRPSVILCLREEQSGPIVACVLLRKKPAHCYLGMLSVAPELQDKGLGRALLDYSETYARAWGSERVVMTVVHVRETLIAWYERRGYSRTGESIPFPYNNKNLGSPQRADLSFIVLNRNL
jgi:ribosomal protein S18 acetylase RimI-like enzyme